MTATTVEPVIDATVLRQTISVTTRPPHPSAWAASIAFAWRAMRKIRHVPMQLLDVTMFPIMFTLLFTYIFGGQIAGSPSEYIQFLLPGILVMTVTMITIYTGMGLNYDLSKGCFDRFRSLPIWRPSLLVGMMLADTARYAVASTVVIALGLIIGFRPDGGALGVLGAVGLLLVFCFALAWVWTTLAFSVTTPEQVMNLSMTILFPLTFASNVFVDPSTMPGWLQPIVEVNPISQLTYASRALMHGTGAEMSMVWVLVWSVGLVAVFAPLTMRLFAKER